MACATQLALRRLVVDSTALFDSTYPAAMAPLSIRWLGPVLVAVALGCGDNLGAPCDGCSDGGVEDASPCAELPDATTCGDGKLCIGGACVESRCGDG